MHMSLLVICKKMDEWILVIGTQWCGIELPDTHRFFHGLMVDQRTPEFWGVTELEIKLASLNHVNKIELINIIKKSALLTKQYEN